MSKISFAELILVEEIGSIGVIDMYVFQKIKALKLSK